MKISEDTMNVLKNYANINTSLIIFPGNEIKTVAPGLEILSNAKVSETFTEKVSIFDLPQFLGACSTIKNPDFDFKNDHVVISSGKSRIKYWYASDGLMTTLETNLKRSLKNLTFEYTFEITHETIADINKARGALKVGNLSILSQDGRIVLKVHDKDDTSSNVYEIDIGDNTTGHEFSFNFDIMNSLKIIPGNYVVELNPKVARFTAKDLDIVYHISVQNDSFWK